jgi:hypothetical protein
MAAWSKEFGMAGWYGDGAKGGADGGSEPGNITGWHTRACAEHASSIGRHPHGAWRWERSAGRGEEPIPGNTATAPEEASVARPPASARCVGNAMAIGLAATLTAPAAATGSA